MCLYVFKKNSVIIVGKVRLDIAVLPQRNQTNRYFDSFVDVYFFLHGCEIFSKHSCLV